MWSYRIWSGRAKGMSGLVLGESDVGVGEGEDSRVSWKDEVAIRWAGQDWHKQVSGELGTPVRPPRAPVRRAGGGLESQGLQPSEPEEQRRLRLSSCRCRLLCPLDKQRKPFQGRDETCQVLLLIGGVRTGL